MAVTVGILSQGSIGLSLASVPGIRMAASLATAGDSVGALLVGVDCGLDFASLRASAGPEPALFLVFLVAGSVKGGGRERGFLLLSPEPGTPSEAVAEVTDALKSVAEVHIVSLEQLAAAIRFLAAAPALMTVALEGLEEGAVRGALPAELARAFGRQTLLGTALLLEEEDLSPAELKDRVASPGGTTIAGLSVLEDAAVRGAYIRATCKSCEK